MAACKTCRGKGKFMCDRCQGTGQVTEGGVRKTCPSCAGQPEKGWFTCQNCKGTGVQPGT